MKPFNYHHLLYFWTVAKEGSVAAAARRLHVAQPTVSGQVRALEASLGRRLFQRAGRGLAMTETGRTVFRYADEIFTLGAELQDAVRGAATERQVRVRVGVQDVLPKLVVHRMLQPVLSMPERPRLACFEGKFEELVTRLAVHELDVVLGDVPLAPQAGVRAYSHRLGESGLAVFGAPALVKERKRGFPGSLDGAPLLLPTPNTAVRRAVDHWLESRGLRPVVRGEFEDSALLKVFGGAGVGLFVAPSVIEREVREQYGVRLLGRMRGASEQYYAVSMERRIRHPAVALLTDSARTRLGAVRSADPS